MILRLVSLNVNSIVRSDRKLLLNNFLTNNRADIFLLQETKLSEGYSFQFNGYNFFKMDNRLGSGGVAILIKSQFKIRNFKTHKRNGVEMVSVEVLIDNDWITVASVYVHPGNIDFDSLLRIFQHNNHFIFGGDFNARHTAFGDVSCNVIGQHLKEVQDVTNAMIVSPTMPTCFHARSGSFIDKFIFDSGFPLVFSNITNLPSFSDHNGIQISLRCNISTNLVTNNFYIKKFNYTNPNRFNRFIEGQINQIELPSDGNLPPNELEQICDRFSNILKHAIDRFVPTEEIRANGIILSYSTLKIQKHHHSLQRKLHRNIRRGSNPNSIANIKRDIALSRNMLHNAISFDLNNYYRNVLANTNSTRDAFTTVKFHTGYKKRSKLPNIIFDSDDKTNEIIGTENMANAFANHFSTNHELSPNLNSTMSNPVRHFNECLMNTATIITFNENILSAIQNERQLSEINDLLPEDKKNLLTSADEVAQIIAKRPNKKSTGIDGAPYYMIRQFSPEIILFLTILFNHLISTSYFPSCWKTALVTPIPKPNKDFSVLTNWRPISNLNCISKVFERVMVNRIFCHINRLDIFHNQFGFLNKLSTQHALGKLQMNIDRGLNNREATSFVSLDLKAAFDTVWHDGLIFKLGKLGFSPSVIKLIKSFLANRSFAVRLGNHYSSFKIMSSGTPQGSVCSPILFNIYLYDLPTDRNVQTIQYADDTSIFFTHCDTMIAQNSINAHIVKLVLFFNKWKLILNESKTEFINFVGSIHDTSPKLRKNCKNMKISINGHEILPKNNIRFLGLFMHRNNKFIHHVKTVITKSRKAKFALIRLLTSQLIQPHIKVNLYKLYIRPILTYASSIWCKTPNLSSHQMEVLRLFERGILRSAANFHREIGSFRYANNCLLYKTANCPRIDRFVVNNNINFFETCMKNVNNVKFSSLLVNDYQGRYSCLSDIFHSHRNGTLFTDNKLLLFHKAYSDSNIVIYNTNQ